MDLISPWFIKVNEETILFHALTIIDTVTNLVELVRIENKTSAHVAMKFETTWLSRYPRPLYCISDQGGEFIGWGFQQMLERYAIHPRTTTSKNPQANAICERMHQAVGNTLRVFTSVQPPASTIHANQLIDMALSNAMYATGTSFHGSLRATPGSIVFNRDMILDIPFVADLHALQQRRQALIDKRLVESNRKRFSYDYKVGDHCLQAYEIRASCSWTLSD